MKTNSYTTHWVRRIYSLHEYTFKVCFFIALLRDTSSWRYLLCIFFLCLSSLNFLILVTLCWWTFFAAFAYTAIFMLTENKLFKQTYSCLMITNHDKQTYILVNNKVYAISTSRKYVVLQRCRPIVSVNHVTWLQMTETILQNNVFTQISPSLIYC